MQPLPLVSIVIGTYNGEEYLKEQMESLLSQTYGSLEFIICNDLSTDGTYGMLKEYAARDTRIKLTRNQINLGYNRNFGQAMRQASGEYIAIADQDDIWEKRKIQD